MLGGDVRYFQFLVVGETPGERSHAELGVFRWKLTSDWTDEIRVEAHVLVEISSPSVPSGVFSVATGSTRRFFPLEHRFEIGSDVGGTIEVDRLYLRWERPSFRLVAGRQPVTWGVNYFWPAIDLFAPFAPERIDREYKPGIDAVRMTVPIGDFSELELVAAGQGEDFPEDFSLAGLGRFHVGAADVGAIGGRFHTDTVLGAFVTADVSGTGVRAEAAFTHSGDIRDAEMGRERFVRLTVGLDRQLSPTVTLSGEAHWNGFGAKSPEEYLQVALSDRVRRGEVTSLGRVYTGVAVRWRAHPLLAVTAAALTNWGDPSALLQPSAEWSPSDSLVVQLGGFFGLGPGLDPAGGLESEYGFVPAAFWGAVKVYF